MEWLMKSSYLLFWFAKDYMILQNLADIIIFSKINTPVLPKICILNRVHLQIIN